MIELPKFRKAAIIKPKKKEFWLWFIDHMNEEMVEMAKKLKETGMPIIQIANITELSVKEIEKL